MVLDVAGVMRENATWSLWQVPTGASLSSNIDSLILKEKMLHGIEPLYQSSVMSDSLRSFRLQPTRLLCQQDFPGKDTGVGFHFLLQGIFPSQGSNPCPLCIPHCRWILYPLSCEGSLQGIKKHVLLKNKLPCDAGLWQSLNLSPQDGKPL